MAPAPPLDALRAHPNALAPHYSAFRVDKRCLLSGHSHQAWPDIALDGQVQAFRDAADRVDGKWAGAFECAETVGKGYARLLDDPSGSYALAPATHDLLVKFLSGLDLRSRPRIVTTDGEFHAMRRQLERLEEEGLEIVRVASKPEPEVGERLAAQVDDRTAVAMVSCVFYETARIAGSMDPVRDACRRHGAELLVDAYHALNVMPFSLRDQDLEDAWVVGGGYKYCQLGEGNGFLRIPPHCELRPVITGWFADFTGLAGGATGVAYGPGALRFAGATYDPVSHYRAREVFGFFERLEMTPEYLRAVSQHQVGLLIERFDALDLPENLIQRDRSVSLSEIAGFLALRSPFAGELQVALLEREVYTDSRGEVLRLGPAPYLSDRQLSHGIETLGELVWELA